MYMTKKRLKLGMIFNFNPTWMGGIIYLINLVKTLNRLDDNDKPEIFLFYNPSLEKFLEEFKYPYLHAIEWISPSIISGHLKSWLKGKNVFYDDLIKKYEIDTIYPVNKFPVKNKTGAKFIAWFADLQHKHYPEFFSRSRLIHRAIRLQLMLRNASDIIVSSNSVKNDFSRFFKLRDDLRFHIYHFTSVNDDYPDINIEVLRKKYNLPVDYYMVSNQFHKHKNHRVLLQALAIMKKKGIIKYMAMTGKLPSAENSPYMNEIHQIINENNMKDQICMLGVIPRGDQLKIMSHSQAVLQPSLFEGWSTVIEDAISLQVPVIASNLDVNIEQLGDKGTYFHPDNPEELASILSDLPERNMDAVIYGDYSLRIREAAESIMKVLGK